MIAESVYAASGSVMGGVAGRVSRVYEIALAELDVAEVPGKGSNPRINEYLSTVGLSGDDTPWCAAFVGWTLEQAGYRGTGGANARSYETFGMKVEEKDLKKGDIVVLKRGRSEWQGHVTLFDSFVTDADGNRRVKGLGGNQRDKVCFATYAVGDVLTYRRPKEVVDSTTVAAAAGSAVAKAAEHSVDFVTVISAEGDKVQDLLPLISNGSLQTVLASISVVLVVYVIFERIRRLWQTGV